MSDPFLISKAEYDKAVNSAGESVAKMSASGMRKAMDQTAKRREWIKQMQSAPRTTTINPSVNRSFTDAEEPGLPFVVRQLKKKGQKEKGPYTVQVGPNSFETFESQLEILEYMQEMLEGVFGEE